MADKATLINKGGNKQVVDVGSTQAQDLFGQGYSLMGSTVAETKPVITTPINTPATEPVAISGAEFNTKEKQQANFDNIQPIGNTLYGTPRSPVVPDVIPQTDFGNALSSEQSAQMESTANQKVGFNEKQIGELNKANERRVAGTASDIDIKNLTYAEGKGWSPTEAKQEEVIEPSTTDKIFNLMGNLTQERINAKEKAMKDQDLMAKGEAIAIAQTLANKLRTDLQNQGILDIKKEDAIRSKPILTSQIQGQLSEMSREQKLDTMIMQNNYNNALVELQIAEGNYDRAREIVKETADDAYNMSVDKLNTMLFKNEIEDMAAQKLEKSLLEEREMALNGYVHIKSPESLKGLTEDQIYRDPVNGNIYMKPEPDVSQIINVGGRMKGLDSKGNIIRDFGSTASGLSIAEQLSLLNSGMTIGEDGTITRDTSNANVDQIASAIKQIESNNNYEAKGASGEYGAYQFMPKTWEEWSSQYAQQVLQMSMTLNPTPENQDAVAKWKISQWVSQGLSPEQIAAKWNSGSEIGWENKNWHK